MPLVLKSRDLVLDEFEIEFVKLKDGTHHFQYRIYKEFFEAFESEEVIDANVQVNLELNKHPNWMNVNFQVIGMVGLTCDRCLEKINMPVDADYTIIYRQQDTGGKSNNEDTEIIILAPSEFKFSVSRPVYETILLNLPMLRNCDQLESKPCNLVMLEKLKNVNTNSTENQEPVDPRWNKLKDLL